MRIARIGCAGIAALAAVGFVLPDSAARASPILLSSGQAITPTAAAGAVYSTLHRGGAISLEVSPDRRTLLVLTSGYNMFRGSAGGEAVLVYDIAAHAPVQRQVLRISTAYAGIAFAPDGNSFYVGTGGGDSVLRYTRAPSGWVSGSPPMPLGHRAGVGNHQGPSTAGLAVSRDGRTLVVADIYNDSVSRIDLTRGVVTGDLDLRPGKENPARTGVAGGETPFWVAIRGNSTAYVSSQRDREIDVLDITTAIPRLIARIPVAGTPNKMILDRAGTRLFVAADNDDSVQVIDTASNRRIARIDVAAPSRLLPPGPRYRGASPNALALSPDEKTLYVSNGGENAIAVVDVRKVRAPVVEGLLPTGWYPDALAVVNGWIYALNAKSRPGPNPAYRPHKPSNQYVLQLEHAGFLAEPLPGAPNLARLTDQVAANDGFSRKPDPHDAAVMAALRQRIRHIIYIVKENRTYDQLLGDLGRGNGDPALVEFGRAITPNFHRLATDFVDIDNFYDSGAVSGNGWPWSTSARETDFNVKTIPLEYSRRPTHAPYDAEGQVRGVDVGIPTLAARRAADPDYPDDPDLLPGTRSDDAPDGPDDTSGPAHIQHGHIWDAALKAGLRVRNYGFFYDLDRYFPTERDFGKPNQAIPLLDDPYASRTIVGFSVNPTLIRLSDPYFRGFDNRFPDVFREREWAREFAGFEASGGLPSLTLLRLMHDHMGSFSAATHGVNTPELQQADNDYAVGLVVDRVAHSRFRDDTLIFVIEDDAQDGPDHVDAHRSTAYVVGPYVRQGAVVSTRYSTVNMLRTIEDILGIGHLNLNDALQPPMTDIFDLTRTHWTYSAAPSQALYATTLPLPRRAQAGPVPRSTHAAAWWTAHTRGYDWSHEDRVPAMRFNQVVWHGLFGDRAYPIRHRNITPN